MISSSFYLPKIQFCFLNTEICVCSQLQKILSFISLNRSFPSLAQFSFKIPNSVSTHFMASIFNYIFHCKFYFCFLLKCLFFLSFVLLSHIFYIAIVLLHSAKFPCVLLLITNLYSVDFFCGTFIWPGISHPSLEDIYLLLQHMYTILFHAVYFVHFYVLFGLLK